MSRAAFALSQPVVTGTSVLGLKYRDGVILAADTLGSYGSLARYRGVSRMLKIGEKTIVGATGDYADFQFLKDVINEKVYGEKKRGNNKFLINDFLVCMTIS